MSANAGSSSGDLDTAGMQAGAEPVDGGVCILNAAVPPGHADHQVWRAPSNDELAAGASARKATAVQRRQAARAHLRMARNRLLADSDWTQIPDAPLSADQVAAFKAWRQQLRDFAVADVADPENPPPFPDPPAAVAEGSGAA